MPPTVPHTLIAVRGILGAAGTTPETWQYGIRYQTSDFPPLPAARTAMLAAFNTFHTSPGTHLSGRTYMTEVRYSSIGSNGLQIGNTIIQTMTPVPGGGGNTPLLPPQCSVVVSLLTDNRGKGQRGRFFLPVPAVTLEADFTLSTSDQNDISGAATFLLNALNAQAVSGSPGVVIIGHTGAGTVAKVTKTRVGQVVDTHRSRRRSLPELYREQVLS